MDYTQLRGIRLSKLRALRPILERWLYLNASIGSHWARYYDDCPWWYNERATLSFLAGAVWRAGGWAFEEFTAGKQAATTRSKPSVRTGRCDINFGVGDSEYVGEAKQCWPLLGTSANPSREVVSSLEAAERDARQLTEMGLPCLGIAFASPRLHVKKRAQIRHELATFARSVGLIRDATIAWVFPLAAHDLMPENLNKQYIYPGVMIVVRRAA